MVVDVMGFSPEKDMGQGGHVEMLKESQSIVWC